ncbi:MAG: phage holin family protein [Patescibacteria group bacterium]
MVHLLLRVLGGAAAVLAAAYLVPGIHVADFYVALIVAILLGIIGVTLKPILAILTLPITLLTFGLFSFIINAAILWFVASFVDGFDIDTFVAALIGSLVISVVQWVLHRIV